MENEPTNKSYQELSLNYVKDSFADYFSADLRGFISDDEETFLKRGIRMSLNMAQDTANDPYDIVIAGIEGSPSSLRLPILEAFGPSMGLVDSEIEEIRTIFGIF